MNREQREDANLRKAVNGLYRRLENARDDRSVAYAVRLMIEEREALDAEVQAEIEDDVTEVVHSVRGRQSGRPGGAEPDDIVKEVGR